MNITELASIGFLIIGLTLFTAGIAIYWLTTPTAEWSTIVIMIGMLLVIGAIVLLIVSFDPVVTK
jgi:uncharacterized membrane protein